MVCVARKALNLVPEHVFDVGCLFPRCRRILDAEMDGYREDQGLRVFDMHFDMQEESDAVSRRGRLLQEILCRPPQRMNLGVLRLSAALEGAVARFGPDYGPQSVVELHVPDLHAPDSLPRQFRIRVGVEGNDKALGARVVNEEVGCACR